MISWCPFDHRESWIQLWLNAKNNFHIVSSHLYSNFELIYLYDNFIDLIVCYHSILHINGQESNFMNDVDIWLNFDLEWWWWISLVCLIQNATHYEKVLIGHFTAWIKTENQIREINTWWTEVSTHSHPHINILVQCVTTQDWSPAMMNKIRIFGSLANED